ncbi:MAG: hypothetical protein SOV73_08810 [Candidatus Faecivivens sp.]|nr:hypothetical protein [Oscillospiraceae bacterium]MDY2713410.1 hypothetical protein [Candidatus Faecivivens sp.]
MLASGTVPVSEFVTVSYDLHIHSCLSPCGEEEMTPNNIVGMAQILELQLLAVADHNTARQLPAIAELAEQAGILLVPAIEITTAEEAHILSLFPDLPSALAVSDILYDALPPVKNRPDIFGRQIIMDAEDHPVGELEKLLINATRLSIGEVFSLVRSYGGLPIPAHIDKNAYSVISSLGMIPPELEVRTVEISPAGIKKGYRPPEKGYRIISDSDAHSLDIFSGHQAGMLELKERTARAVIDALAE